MLSRFLRKTSREEEETQFAMGDILNGDYVVKAVERDERGAPVYKCARRQPGHDEVVITYVGRKENMDGDTGTLNHEIQAEAPSARGLTEVDLFELQLGRDTLVYSVKRKPIGVDCLKHGTDLEDRRTLKESLLSTQPDSGIVMYKQGDCRLKVSIPPKGYTWNAKRIPRAVYSALWISLILMLSAYLLDLVSGQWEKHSSSMAFIGIAFIILKTVGIVMYTHEILIITPAKLSIKRTVRFRKISLNSESAATETMGDRHELFMMIWPQICQEVTNTMKAEIKEYKEGKETVKECVLINDEGEDALYALWTDAEKQWVASEINETLENIRQKKRES